MLHFVVNWSYKTSIMMTPMTLPAAFLVFCLASHSTQGLRLPRHADTELNLIEEQTDLDVYMKEQSATKFAGISIGDNKSWRSELLTYMLKSQWTDCFFVVGPDGKEEKIEAHAVILAIASPVLKSALTNSSSFRLKEWQPSEFKAIIRMIYSGDTCFKNIDEACTLMRLAKGLKIEFVFEAAQNYIEGHMHPHRYWDAFICARQTSAGKLLKAVNQVMNANTSKFMKDPGFKKISSADLTNILERDNITVKSEAELYSFVMNWALAQVKKSGQRASADVLKEKIGMDALKNIRFLTMTSLEYTTLYSILDYEDSLTVKQIIANPGSMEMPAYLSSSRIKRKELAEATEETFTSVVLDDKCEGYSEEQSIYDHLTTLNIMNCPYKLAGIQIPKSLESRNDCQVKEHFDVLILNPKNEVVYKQAYDQAPPCTSNRYIKNDDTSFVSVNDDKLIDVKLNEVIDTQKALSGNWKVKIVFRDVKKYPLHVQSGYEDSSEDSWSMRYTTKLQDFMGSPGYTNFVMLSRDTFVYGIYGQGADLPC